MGNGSQYINYDLIQVIYRVQLVIMDVRVGLVH